MEEKQYDGQTLKEALKSAELLLESRIKEINALNVFPVPDGDTGINMYLTLQSATEAVKDLPSTSASEISSKAAMGALMGARGNSGVILSQILRGLAKGMEMKDKFSAFDFAQALRHASDTAYKSIGEPVEGTILTVIREASEMALQQARRGGDLKQTLATTVSQARDTVTRTPEMLSTLKEAGVVDAGGKGLFYVFLGMKNYFARKMPGVEGCKAIRRKTGPARTAAVYGFDLQFLVEGSDLPLEEMRSRIAGMGESVLVVGDGDLIRVHIHTKNPQAVMDYCQTKGTLKDLVRENLDDQVKDFHKQKGPSAGKPGANRTARPRRMGLNNLPSSP